MHKRISIGCNVASHARVPARGYSHAGFPPGGRFGNWASVVKGDSGHFRNAAGTFRTQKGFDGIVEGVVQGGRGASLLLSASYRMQMVGGGEERRRSGPR
ncbi:hypothetical protein SUGI_0970660 [Cryptomeria japonica]|nr:hypothetical protein SUGI_0970660 [Cryptomeria japonica]